MPDIVCVMGYEDAARRLRSTRTSMGFRTRARFQQALVKKFGASAPSERLLGALERGERSNYDEDTLRSVDLWYGLPENSFLAWVHRDDTPGRSVLDNRLSDVPERVTPAAEGADGEGLTDVQQGAVAAYIAEQRENLRSQFEEQMASLDRLARAFEASLSKQDDKEP